MTALMVLLVLAACVAAGAAARLLPLFRPHTGRHTAAYLATHDVDAKPARRIDIGEWIDGRPARRRFQHG